MTSRFFFAHVEDRQELEPDEDVCLNCGRYFFWTPATQAANMRLGRGSQRCLRCALEEEG